MQLIFEVRNDHRLIYILKSFAKFNSLQEGELYVLPGTVQKKIIQLKNSIQLNKNVKFIIV